MRHVLAGFSAFRVSAALGGGKAPGCWQRDWAQKTERLTAVRRGIAWVKEFGAVHPRLCESPLLGTTLSALTRLVSQTQEAQPKTAKARFAHWGNPLQSNWNKAGANALINSPLPPEDSDHRSAARRKILKQTPAGRSTELLSQFHAQADYLLLSRLAGSELELEGPERKLAKPFPMRLREKGSEGLLSIHRDFYPSADLFNRLACRTRKLVSQKRQDAARTAKSAQDDAQPSFQWPSLAEQWAMPLDGRGVSQDLLERLTYKELVGIVGAGSEPASVGTSSRRVSHSQQLLRRSDEWDGWPRESVGAALRGRPFPEPTQRLASRLSLADSAFFAPEFGVNGQEGHSAGESKSLAPIVPPNVTAFLPEKTRKETMMATDDLDALAAKIKRILDDQARRYGIDV